MDYAVDRQFHPFKKLRSRRDFMNDPGIRSQGGPFAFSLVLSKGARHAERRTYSGPDSVTPAKAGVQKGFQKYLDSGLRDCVATSETSFRSNAVRSGIQ